MPASIFVQTQDRYVDALTLQASQQFRQVQFAVSAPYSAYCQLAKLDKSGQPYFDETDIPTQPGQGGYDDCYGIRFKSYDPANPTTVLAVGFFADDPTPTGFIGSSAQFTPSGVVSANSWLPGDTKVSAISASHADPNGGFWLLADGSAIPSQYTALIAILGATLPDGRGRAVATVGTHTDVNALGKSDGYPLGTRTLIHNTNPGTFKTSANASDDGSVSGTPNVVLTDHLQTTVVASVTGLGGPGGTRPNDTGSFLVAGNLFYHT